MGTKQQEFNKMQYLHMSIKEGDTLTTVSLKSNVHYYMFTKKTILRHLHKEIKLNIIKYNRRINIVQSSSSWFCQSFVATEWFDSLSFLEIKQKNLRPSYLEVEKFILSRVHYVANLPKHGNRRWQRWRWWHLMTAGVDIGSKNNTQCFYCDPETELNFRCDQ